MSTCQACGEPIELVHRADAAGRVVDQTPLWLHHTTRLHHCTGGITATAVATPEPTGAAVGTAERT